VPGFISSLGLLHNPTLEATCSKPPIPSSELPKRHKIAIFERNRHTRPARTGSGTGSQFLVKDDGGIFMSYFKFIAAMVPEIQVF
jgi:hypothetical protein